MDPIFENMPLRTETKYILHAMDGESYCVIMLDDVPDGPLDALDKFEATWAKYPVERPTITNIERAYARLTGPGCGPMNQL